MIPKTIGKAYDVGRIAPVQCICSDTLEDIRIQGHCFLLIILRQGVASFQVADAVFEAFAPCVICFDEQHQPILLNRQQLQCDSVYFHPQFLNINMTFDCVHSQDYTQVAHSHDLFLLRPFTDGGQFVFPLYEQFSEKAEALFSALEEELRVQRDWYWSCRSRSYFMELMLLLERLYGLIGQDQPYTVGHIQDASLRQAVIYIETHFHNNINLDDISQAVSINRNSLTQLFKRVLNATPMEYLWLHRITVAKKHLEFTSLPIKDIALRCGFQTVPHFTRKFKTATGYTPSAFRREAVARRKAAF